MAALIPSLVVSEAWQLVPRDTSDCIGKDASHIERKLHLFTAEAQIVGPGSLLLASTAALLPDTLP